MLGPTPQLAKHIKGAPKALRSGRALQPSSLNTCALISSSCENQQQLRADLKGQYDFIVCGSGSPGSVVARRLAENPTVSVLLLEARGDDDVPSVMEPDQWPTNLGSERDWNFHSHETCLAEMGRDATSVVDSQLKVYGTDNLRVADGSIMPCATTDNTRLPASSLASVPPRSCGWSIDSDAHAGVSPLYSLPDTGQDEAG